MAALMRLARMIFGSLFEHAGKRTQNMSSPRTCNKNLSIANSAHIREAFIFKQNGRFSTEVSVLLRRFRDKINNYINFGNSPCIQRSVGITR